MIEPISGCLVCPECRNTGVSARYEISAPEMAINANGQLTLKEISSSGDIKVRCGRCGHIANLSDFLRK